MVRNGFFRCLDNIINISTKIINRGFYFINKCLSKFSKVDGFNDNLMAVIDSHLVLAEITINPSHGEKAYFQ